MLTYHAKLNINAEVLRLMDLFMTKTYYKLRRIKKGSMFLDLLGSDQRCVDKTHQKVFAHMYFPKTASVASEEVLPCTSG